MAAAAGLFEAGVCVDDFEQRILRGTQIEPGQRGHEVGEDGRLRAPQVEYHLRAQRPELDLGRGLAVAALPTRDPGNHDRLPPHGNACLRIRRNLDHERNYVDRRVAAAQRSTPRTGMM
jgi:hypothetical protein